MDVSTYYSSKLGPVSSSHSQVGLRARKKETR